MFGNLINESDPILNKHFLNLNNIRSLRRHFDELTCLIDRLPNKPKAICLRQTWLRNDDDMGLYQIEGYSTSFVKNRQGRRGGGLAIYVEKGLTVTHLNITADIENIVLQIETKTNELVIALIYRPPQQTVTYFLSELESILEALTFKKTKINSLRRLQHGYNYK